MTHTQPPAAATTDVLTQPAPGAVPAQAPTHTSPKHIATLPPLAEINDDIPLSPRTGEPRRPFVVLLGAISSYLAVAALAWAYALHWWRAVHPDTYATSSRLVEWLAPDPGMWLSLTLEGALALALVAAAGAVGVAGFQAWNGWRWSRPAGLVALALVGGFAAITNDWAFIGVGLAAVTAACAWLPAAARYFRLWDRVRGQRPERYRRPAWIFYGRLPRFR